MYNDLAARVLHHTGRARLLLDLVHDSGREPSTATLRVVIGELQAAIDVLRGTAAPRRVVTAPPVIEFPEENTNG